MQDQQNTVHFNIALLDELKALFANTADFSTAMLPRIYAKGIVFVDPVHKVEGIAALQEYFDRSYSDVISCRFEFIGEAVEGETAVLRWIMQLSHRKLAAGRTVSLPGVSLSLIHI